MKQEQSKHGPLQNLEVGSSAMEDWAHLPTGHTLCVLFVVIVKSEKSVDNLVIKYKYEKRQHATQLKIVFAYKCWMMYPCTPVMWQYLFFTKSNNPVCMGCYWLPDVNCSLKNNPSDLVLPADTLYIDFFILYRLTNLFMLRFWLCDCYVFETSCS